MDQKVEGAKQMEVLSTADFNPAEIIEKAARMISRLFKSKVYNPKSNFTIEILQSMPWSMSRTLFTSNIHFSKKTHVVSSPNMQLTSQMSTIMSPSSSLKAKSMI